MPIGPLLNDLLTVVRRQHLQLPSRLVLLLKTLVMTEGLAAQLDPTFQLTSVLTPYAQRLLLQQNAPWQWTRRLGQTGLEAARLGAELPEHFQRILTGLEHGTLEVGVRPTGIEPLMRRAEQLANRIVLGLLAAAFINGLAVLLSAYHPPGWSQWAGVVFTVGFLVAAGLGAYLAWTILRSGRR
jgi:ubiquinone biosynthesis protein